MFALAGVLALVGTANARAAVLYDQYDNGAGFYVFSDEIGDRHIADDFVVPGGQQWSIGAIDVPVDTGTTGIPTGFNVFFYDNGGGNLPNNLLASRPNSPYSTAAGTHTITLSSAVSLNPGTYWISVQSHMTSGGGGIWGWQARSVQSNSGAAYENPNGSVNPGCTTWVRTSACFTDPYPDQVFRLSGTASMPGPQTLTVNKNGSGSGAVSSSPAGIDCGPTCSAQFDFSTSVALAASAASGSSFAGWSGAGCSGTGPCQVVMDSDQTVTATFTARTPNTLIRNAKVNQAKRKATFKFKAVGSDTGFECKLTGQGKKLKHFRKCSSPKTYKKLKVGKHVFYVRAIGPGGKDPTPAKKKFRING